MRQAKKPTRAQKILIHSWRLNSDNWLVVTDTPDAMTIRHRYSDRERVITKSRHEAEKGKFVWN